LSYNPIHIQNGTPVLAVEGAVAHPLSDILAHTLSRTPVLTTKDTLSRTLMLATLTKTLSGI
jgi:hypothetical protein